MIRKRGDSGVRRNTVIQNIAGNKPSSKSGILHPQLLVIFANPSIAPFIPSEPTWKHAPKIPTRKPLRCAETT